MIPDRTAIFNKTVLVITLLLLLVACSPPQKPSPLRIGTNVWTGYEPLYLARELGYLKPNRVRLVEFSSSQQVMRAFRNASIDAAGVTLDEALLLVEQGFTPKIIFIMDLSQGGDAIVSQANIESIEELRGKRIGVESNALGVYVLSRALELYGMTSDDVTMVPMSVYEHEQRFLNKEVDALVTFDPVLKHLLSGNANMLFDSGQIPGEIMDVFIVREEYLQAHPQQLHDLVSNWYQSLAYIDGNMSSAAAFMTQRLKLTPVEVIETFNGLILPDQARTIKMLSAVSQQDAPSVQVTSDRLARIMKSNGLLRYKFNTDVLFLEQSKLMDIHGERH